MNAGDRRFKVMVQKPITGKPNKLNEIELATDDDFQDVREWWVDIRPLRSVETQRARQAQQDTTHSVQGLYFAGLDKTHRLVWETRHGTHKLGIIGIVDVDGRGITHELECMEIGI